VAGFLVELFAHHGYECYDAIRWRHWTDENVKFWYAQNAFLYMAKGKGPPQLPVPHGLPFRVVHPKLLDLYQNDPRFIPPRLAVRALRWRVQTATEDVNDWLKGHRKPR